MRILLIDDTEDSRDLTEAALLSAGYTDIATAASGWEALKILDVGGTSEGCAPIDVVLLDIVMPEMDGVECCARVRNDARYTDLPIIMVTALDDMDSLANAFVAGATDYITKPVNRVELVARVRAALRLKQELDRRQARERELLSFVSNWGDRRATVLIDETTGLFAGEAVEAYLTATSNGEGGGGTVSILAVMLDCFDVYRTKHGDGAARKVLAQVAHAVRRLGATVGIVAAAYRNGTIVLVAPELEASPARDLGETLRVTVAKLRVPNSEAVAADHITASVSAITGRVKRTVDRVQLLTQAIARAQDAAGAGGNRVLAMSI
jgi:PleD family two-component response regulator